MSPLAHHHALETGHVTLLGGDFKVTVDDSAGSIVSVKIHAFQGSRDRERAGPGDLRDG